MQALVCGHFWGWCDFLFTVLGERCIQRVSQDSSRRLRRLILRFIGLASRVAPGAGRVGEVGPLFISLTMDTETLVENKYTGAEINRGLTPEQKIQFLRTMVRIRNFEHTSLKYYNKGKMGGVSASLHRAGVGGGGDDLAAGEE